MSFRWLAAVIVSLALVASGCSDDKPPKAGESSAKSTESSESESTESESTETETESAGPLGVDACVEITSARLDLILANTAEEATPPADVMKSYDPPESVVEAIDHFVETGGAQYDDPDYDEFDARIEDWVNEVCPS